MKFQKLNQKLESIKTVLSLFDVEGEKGKPSKVCNKSTWMIAEIEVNGEKAVSLLNPRATKVIYKRLVEYGKTHKKISFFGFNRYIMELGDPAYFSSDLNLVVIQDDGYEGFANNIDRDKLDAEMDKMLKINPNNPQMQEEWWCMDSEVE